jgi:hypothetical protein
MNNIELDTFLELVENWEQADCVAFIQDLFYQHPELIESPIVQSQLS